MKSIHQKIAVSFNYPVHFTSGLFASQNRLLAETVINGSTDQPSRILVVIDNGVAESHPDLASQILSYFRHEGLELVGSPLVLPGGELVKNDTTHINAIHRLVNEYGLDRHSYVMAIGGGAILDLAGYAAATAHRGVRLIRLPTTVLAQNDSGVGVKNGINAFGKKNFLGTFAPPFAVINDFDFLTTLSDRDWISGISEAIKVALLKDAAFFTFLEGNADLFVGRDMTAMKQMIYRCAEFHLDHISKSGDPFEMGSSRPLDFGHWSAHKLEQLTGYRLRHGEAVSIGIALDSTYSYLLGLLPEETWQRILRLFMAVNLPVFAPELSNSLDDRTDARNVLTGLSEFREHLGGELTVILLKDIGRPFEVQQIDEQRMIDSIRLLESEYGIYQGVAA